MAFKKERLQRLRKAVSFLRKKNIPFRERRRRILAAGIEGFIQREKLSGEFADSLLALANENPEARAQAVDSLDTFGDKRAVRFLVSVLKKDPVAKVRSRAAFSLGFLNDSRAFPSLVFTLKDSNAEVRRFAASSLFDLFQNSESDRARLIAGELDSLGAEKAGLLLAAIKLKKTKPPILPKFPSDRVGLASFDRWKKQFYKITFEELRKQLKF